MRRPLLPAALALAALALPALSGCDSEATTSRGTTDGVSAAPAVRSASPAPKSASPEGTSPAPSATKNAPDYDPKANAAADIETALRVARQDGRPVLVDFGADWCLDCRVLNARFKESGPSALLAKYHVVKVDVGDFDHNLNVAERYVDLRTSGIPALTVLDSASGRVQVATNRGEFANARTMSAAQVEEFLKRWQ
ncbi:thioredoxin family protein [Streptomyces sp. NPDC048448]|uniref:Thioredoxin family protein n=1 Tax=Streptomyces kaempferi TaxID=333725 RepID=A0ABW3XG18_9ACTN|nr:thioredoxin family protein [Streptomyces sp. NBC_01462]